MTDGAQKAPLEEATMMMRSQIPQPARGFYQLIDGRFSHGGTDVFVLARTDDGWRIASLVWTVEPEPAEPSPLGPPDPTPSGPRDMEDA